MFPTQITADIAALTAAVTQFQADQGALPSLAAAAKSADAAYAAAQAQSTSDATAINTALTQLQTDIAAFEAGTLVSPPTVPGGNGPVTVPAGSGNDTVSGGNGTQFRFNK